MIDWKLKQHLDSNGLSTYQLVKELEGKVSANAVYHAAREDINRVNFDTLDEVVRALRRLTGKQVSVCDLLEYVEE